MSETQPPTIEPWMLNLLACPVCDGHPKLKLLEDGVTLQCENDKHQFPISDGIPLLREQDAVLIGTSELAA